MPTATKPAPTSAADLVLNEKQHEIMRLVLKHFAEFRKREAHHYLSNGMATTHVMKDAIEHEACLFAFWPQHLISRHGNVNSFMIEPGVFSKVNSGVRDVLDQLAKKGYLVKMGNEDERRWMPVKSLIGVTL
jgi:hypothetical protein